jgi:ricin-type beta-trefoil lectin protein
MKWSSLPGRLRASRRAAVGVSAFALAAAGVSVLTAPVAEASGGTTYYVSTSGSDSNSGTSASSPWKSLAKVDGTMFQPGDQILFQDGNAWSGQLWPKGSGAADSPITIGSYGSGAKPSFAGGGKVADTVKIWNQQYWTITDIDVSNNAPSTGTAGANLGDFRGIHVGGDDSKTLSGFTIDAVSVHDVTGVDNWVGGSTANDKTGIHFQMGWDRAKNTGGIVFNTTVPNIAAPPSTPTILNDITVENSSIQNTSWGGIVTKQYVGDALGAVPTGWGLRTSASDSKYAPFTHVTIQGNYITQRGTAYGTNGMLLDDVRDGVVQNNLIDRVGTCGIELDYSDVATVQHNEVTGTTVKGGGDDSNAVDPDMGTTNIVIQYNYLHDNNVGFLVYQIKFGGSSIWRYNIVANSSLTSMQLGSVSGSTARIYNNTFYNTSSAMADFWTASNYIFTNNIFYTTAAKPTMPSGTGIVYNNNLYGGNSPTIPSGDKHAIVGNPQFANPTAGGTGTQVSGPDLSAGLNWLIPANSPAANAGVTIANNGGVDYIGTAVPAVPDIGALQHSGQSSGGGSSGELHAVGAGKCLDVPNGTQTNSTQLDIYTCSGASNQIFTYNSSHELTVYGGAKCVDAYARGTSAGTKVDIYDCNGGTNQQWNLNANGTITTAPSGLCLDVTGASTANGALVELWTCNGGTNQQWKLG